MWTIKFEATCAAARSELLSATPEQAAGIVESILSVALLEVCGSIEVNRVRVTYVDSDEASLERHTLQRSGA